jgi:hypothetical protein
MTETDILKMKDYCIAVLDDVTARNEAQHIAKWLLNTLDELAATKVLNARLVKMLKRYEWSGGNSVERICPECGVDSTWTNPVDHKDHCDLGNLLKEVQK